MNNFGFTTEQLYNFIEQYTTIKRADYNNNYLYTKMLYDTRQTIGKENFKKLLMERMQLTQTAMSNIGRMLSIYQKISDKSVWEKMGWENMHKLFSMPKDRRDEIIDLLRSEPEKGFEIYLKYIHMKRNRKHSYEENFFKHSSKENFFSRDELIQIIEETVSKMNRKNISYKGSFDYNCNQKNKRSRRRNRNRNKAHPIMVSN